MFLLFRIWTTNSRLCVRNLHSNMFLLFLGRELRFLQSAIIYIPICFYYFKYADCDDDEIAIFTFQYVSIISYVAEVGGCFAHNLHSNMFLLFRATAASSLAAFNSFTFQYVSIISICLFINIFQCFRFTFQYVSIIFGIIAIEKICEIHLHSNMFLLFLTGVSFHSGMGQIYIPICFYYFRTN